MDEVNVTYVRHKDGPTIGSNAVDLALTGSRWHLFSKNTFSEQQRPAYAEARRPLVLVLWAAAAILTGSAWGQQGPAPGTAPTVRITKGSALAVVIPPDKTTYEIELSSNPIHDVVFEGTGSPPPDYTLTTASRPAPTDDGTMNDPRSQIFRLTFSKIHVGTHTYTITSKNSAGESTATFTVNVKWQGPAEPVPGPVSTGVVGVPSATNSVSAVSRPATNRITLRAVRGRPQSLTTARRLNLRLPEFLSRLAGGGWLPGGGGSAIGGNSIGGGTTNTAAGAATPPPAPNASDL